MKVNPSELVIKGTLGLCPSVLYITAEVMAQQPIFSSVLTDFDIDCIILPLS